MGLKECELWWKEKLRLYHRVVHLDAANGSGVKRPILNWRSKKIDWSLRVLTYFITSVSIMCFSVHIELLR